MLWFRISWLIVVFYDLPDDSFLLKEEIFGPVLSIGKPQVIDKGVDLLFNIWLLDLILSTRLLQWPMIQSLDLLPVPLPRTSPHPRNSSRKLGLELYVTIKY